MWPVHICTENQVLGEEEPDYDFDADDYEDQRSRPTLKELEMEELTLLDASAYRSFSVCYQTLMIPPSGDVIS